jgi:hypothetical protein
MITPLAPLDRTSPGFRAALDALFMTTFPNLITEINSQLDALLGTLSGLAAGGAFAIPYRISSVTTDADPTAGFLRFDNFAVQTSAAALRISLTGLDTTDHTAEIDTWDDSTSLIKGEWRLQGVGATTKWLSGTLSALVSHTGYRNVTVANVRGSSAAPFAANDPVVLFFQPTGDKGDTGSQVLTYDAQTSNVQLAAADFASATRLMRDITSGTVTQTIVALAGIANGDYCLFKNSTTNIQTIDPNGAETIDGASTIKVYPGECCAIVKSAGGFHTFGLAAKGEWVEISRATAASSATLDFANVFTSDFDEYEICIENLKPATTGTDLWLRTSTDGVTYDAGAGNYDAGSVRLSSGGTVTAAGGSDSKILLNAGVGIGNGTGQSISAKVQIVKPSAVSNPKIYWSGIVVTGSTVPATVWGAGIRAAAAAITSFRLLFSSGNAASGDVVVRARKI